jgi:DNA-binding Lrp family transcriptional regulator
MEPLLKLLASNASLAPSEMAAMLNLTESEVRDRLRELSASQVVLGYRAVLNEEKLGRDLVRAVIEVRITPERGGGFDRIAERIAKFDQVAGCYLISGGYDLLVVVEGASLREVASFVSEKLSTLEPVISTATHFRLKTYKENGALLVGDTAEERLAVSP